MLRGEYDTLLNCMRRRKAAPRKASKRTAKKKATPTTEPPEPADIGKQGEHGKVTEDIAIARRREVLTLMRAGATSDQVVNHCVLNFGMTEHGTRDIMREIRASWRRDYEEEVHSARAATVHRLRDDLVRMRAQTPRPWRDIRGHENLLAKIEGTMQPVKLQVIDSEETMRDALTEVLGEMTYEDMLTEIQRGIERDAALVTDGVEMGVPTLPAAE